MCSDRDMYLLLFARGTAPLETLVEELYLGKELFLMTVLCCSNVKVFAQQRYPWFFRHKSACVCMVLGVGINYASKNMFFVYMLGKPVQ